MSKRNKGQSTPADTIETENVNPNPAEQLEQGGEVLETQTGDPAAAVLTDTEAASNEAQNAGRKSIVPNKYGNKYKNGGSDNLATFINEQSAENNAFSFSKFFSLMRANGVDAAKVDHYEAQVNEKRHGAPGRARMTLRNMLATIAKKNGKLTGNDGAEHAIDMSKAPAADTASAE